MRRRCAVSCEAPPKSKISCAPGGSIQGAGRNLFNHCSKDFASDGPHGGMQHFCVSPPTPHEWSDYPAGGGTLQSAAAFSWRTYSTDSHIYEFDPSTQKFVLAQTLATVGAVSFEAFRVGGVQYLAVANHQEV